MPADDEDLDFWGLADRMYDAGVKFGTPIRLGVCDRSLLLPLAELPEIVKTETGEELPAERLDGLVLEGWIPGLRIEDTGIPGFALYAPSRVGLFLSLERAGYEPAELRALAAYEEGLIDAVLVGDDTPYLDDDRELVLVELRARLQDVLSELEQLRTEHPVSNREESDVAGDIEGLQRSLSFLESHSLESMTDAARERTGRAAYRVRWSHERIRLMMLEHELAV